MTLEYFSYIVSGVALTGDDLWLILLQYIRKSPKNHNLSIRKYQIIYQDVLCVFHLNIDIDFTLCYK
jgi:hypothetical protein